MKLIGENPSACFLKISADSQGIQSLHFVHMDPGGSDLPLGLFVDTAPPGRRLDVGRTAAPPTPQPSIGPLGRGNVRGWGRRLPWRAVRTWGRLGALEARPELRLSCAEDPGCRGSFRTFTLCRSNRIFRLWNDSASRPDKRPRPGPCDFWRGNHAFSLTAHRGRIMHRWMGPGDGGIGESSPRLPERGSHGRSAAPYGIRRCCAPIHRVRRPGCGGAGVRAACYDSPTPGIAWGCVGADTVGAYPDCALAGFDWQYLGLCRGGGHRVSAQPEIQFGQASGCRGGSSRRLRCLVYVSWCYSALPVVDLKWPSRSVDQVWWPSGLWTAFVSSVIGIR